MKTKITILAIIITLVGLSIKLNAQAPVLLKDSVGNGNASAGFVLGNTFYFKYSVSSLRQQLWKTDGTKTGTQMVKDSLYLDIVGMVNINDTLYFISPSLFSSSAPLALWKSDGTLAGTTIIKTFPGLTGVGLLSSINNVCYFRLAGAVWKTDGTSAGTVQVKPSLTAASLFYKVTTDIVFIANSVAVGYNALWRTDGTSGGTTMIKDSVMYVTGGNSLGELLTINGTLYFTVSSGASYSLWKTDGTTAGTFVVGGGMISNLTNLNGVLYFRSSSPLASLMKSDGTVSGTNAVTGLNNVGFSLSSMGNKLYLGGKNNYDWEPYTSDGTLAGTLLLKDINPGTTGSNPMYQTKVNNTMCFVANDGINGNQIWKTDGTTAGTKMAYAVADTISSNEAPTVRIAFNNYLLFIHGGGTTGKLYSLLVGSGTIGVNTVIKTNNNLNIYPNPSSGIVKIDWKGNENSLIQVFNLLGDEVLQKHTASLSTEINLSNHAKGIYFIKIQDGEKIYTNKIVVQ